MLVRGIFGLTIPRTPKRHLESKDPEIPLKRNLEKVGRKSKIPNKAKPGEVPWACQVLSDAPCVFMRGHVQVFSVSYSIVACRWVLVHLQKPQHNYSAFILRCLDLATFFASWHTGTKVFVFRFSHQNNFLYSITRKLHALTSKTEEESMKGVVVFLSLSLETIYGFSFKL